MDSSHRTPINEKAVDRCVSQILDMLSSHQLQIPKGQGMAVRRWLKNAITSVVEADVIATRQVMMEWAKLEETPSGTA